MLVSLPSFGENVYLTELLIPSAASTSLPTGWRIVRLGDAATLQRGVDLPIQDRVHGPIPVYGSNGILGMHGQLVQPGPGVITGRSGSIGEVYFSTGPFWPLNTTLYVRDFHGNSERFIFYLLSWLKLERFAASTGVPSLNRNFVHPLAIPLPPLPEQRAIAAVLDSIDGAIERTDDVIAATERLRDALLHEMLTRGVPGWHSAWKDAPGLGTVPASWEVVRLGDVAEVASGQVDPRGAAFQSLLFVAPDDIESDTGRLISRRTAADVRAISGKYWFNADDVLFSKIRPYLNKVYVPSEQGLCSADIYPLRPLAKIGRGYLALTLLSEAFAAYTRTCSDRTGIPKVNRVDLMKYRFALPPLEEQQAIAGMLDAVDEAAEQARRQRAGLQDLKASAADALLTGRVRVGV